MNVQKDDHGAVDLVVRRSVRMDAEDEQVLILITDFPLDRLNLVDHFANKGMQVGNDERGLKVDDGTTDVSRQQVHGLFGGGIEATDAQIAADHEHGDIGAGENIG